HHPMRARMSSVNVRLSKQQLLNKSSNLLSSLIPLLSFYSFPSYISLHSLLLPHHRSLVTHLIARNFEPSLLVNHSNQLILASSSLAFKKAFSTLPNLFRFT